MKNLYVCLLLLFFSGSPVFSQWSMNTMINTVVCDTSGLQKDVRMESDGSGGVFLVWRDYRKGTNSSDIYAQRLDSLGYPLWTKNGVPICTLAADQSTPTIISDDRGGVIIAWSDWRSGIERDLYAQRLDSNGNLLWQTNGAPITTLFPREHSQKVVRDDHGGLIAVWEKQRTIGTWDIWAQRLDSTGAPVWQNGGFPICLESSNRINHRAQRDGKGGIIVSFQDQRNGEYDIYAQRLDANGNRLWGHAGTPVCIANGVQNNAKIDPEKNSGGVYIVWIDARSQQDYDIYSQRLDSNGTRLWGASGVPVCTAVGNQSAQDIVSNNKINGVIVTWKDERSGHFDIYSQKLEPSGAAVWTTNGVVVCNALGDQLNPNIVSDKDSGAIVTWQDKRDADWDIYAQRIGKNGSLKWINNGEIVCNAIGDQEAPKNVPDNKGGTIIAWKDERVNQFDDIYAHHLFASGSPNSIKKYSANLGLTKVYPIPIQNKIYVEIDLVKADDLVLSLTDLMGREILKTKTKFYPLGLNKTILEVNQNNLAQGLYLLNVQGARTKFSLKLLNK